MSPNAATTAGRSAAVVSATINQYSFKPANNRLVTLSSLAQTRLSSLSLITNNPFQICTTKTSDYNIYDSGANVNGDNFANNMINLNPAAWKDLTGNDIDSVSDLKKILEDTGRTARITLLFNDNEKSDSFRNVYLIVVNSLNAGSTGATVVNPMDWVSISTPVINDNGFVRFNGRVTNPSWVPTDAVATVTGTVTVDGIGVIGSANQATNSVKWTGISGDFYTTSNLFTGSANAFQSNANSKSKVQVVLNSIAWDKVKYEFIGDKDSVTDTTSSDKGVIAIATGKSITFTVPANTYSAGTYTIKQNGKTLGGPVSIDVSGAADTITIAANGVTSDAMVQIDFDLTLKNQPVPKDPIIANGISDKVISAPNGGWMNEIKAQTPGVYQMPQITGSEGDHGSGSLAIATGTNYDDCIMFVYPVYNSTDKYTLKIDGGTAFTEERGPFSQAGQQMFYIQITDYMNGTGTTGVKNSGVNGTHGTLADSRQSQLCDRRQPGPRDHEG